jgi:hypothetical protein
LFFVVIAFIACTPHEDAREVLQRIQKERREEILKCINEKGSKDLQKLFVDIKDEKLGKVMEANKDNISKEDKLVFINCRKLILGNNVLKNILSSKKKE